MIGPHLRELRRERNLTLKQLAERTGLSTGLLSQVERDIHDPSLETLRRLARTLEVPLFSFFAEEDLRQVAVVRRDRRMTVSSPHGGISYTRISPGSGRLELLEGSLEPGAASADRPWSHPSEECVLAQAGEVLVEVGETLIRLAPGDSCYFDSRTPHRFVNPGTETATFLVSVTPPSY
ncbi:XRE family transcriptional regulator [Saccharopolyspora sp. K220]|uniref:helix-turn-helix domain-containing protein n=1 Tax=Saccharopolyspora soli TaxID=2926618 RepID=UPI001F58F887|nr:XRE family transcriptional regulator [Saccharopolyspora soli]MCI2418235.1 XRE family transcriptional regulator [Saccharopolyspora soli]